MNSFGWMNNSTTLFFLSEESGYSHLYIKTLTGKAKALTSGAYEVDKLTLSKDDRFVYFKANKKHPSIYEIYRVNTIDGKMDMLTDLNGMTDYQLSPDEQQLLLTYSKLTMPPELYIQNIANEEGAHRLTHTVSAAFMAILCR